MIHVDRIKFFVTHGKSLSMNQPFTDKIIPFDDPNFNRAYFSKQIIYTGMLYLSKLN